MAQPIIVGGNVVTYKRSIMVPVFAAGVTVVTGDGALELPPLPESLNGYKLVRAQVSSQNSAGGTGTTDVMVHNITGAVDMLTAAATLAPGSPVGTPGTVDAANDVVSTNDRLRVDVDAVASPAPVGLNLTLEFDLP